MRITVVAANRASCEELDAIFGSVAAAAECRCQRYRLHRGESFRGTPVEEREARLREQAACGRPQACTTTGLIARVEGEPAGWCAVAPRASYPGLVRNSSMAAWTGRHEDRSDQNVWAITCVLVARGQRRHGVGTALITAALDVAREAGAVRLEAYPIDEFSSVGSENHPGLLTMYERAGFEVVHRPSKRRTVVAVTFR